MFRKSTENIAYATWSCLCDTESCDKCKSYDGVSWIPGLVSVPKSPLSSCKSHEGCRCIIVYTLFEEIGATEIAEFIRSAGGKVTREQLGKYEEAKWTLVTERRNRERLASEKALTAYKCEKIHPEEAIALYRECIAIEKEIAENSPEPWRWRDLPYLYNRLTLLLEHLGRHGEALEEIEKYYTLPCQNEGAKSDREAIEKRKIRLEKKL